MNKLFTKIAVLSVGAAMAVGVGALVGFKGGVQAAKAVEVEYSHKFTYSYLKNNVTGSSSDKSSYIAAPAEGTSGDSAVFTLSFGDTPMTPVGDVTVVFDIATLGSGTNPSSSNTTFTAESVASSTQWTGSGLNKYPSSSTYVQDATMTISKGSNTAALSGLKITVGTNTEVRNIRVRNITVSFTYDNGEAPATPEAVEIHDSFDTITTRESFSPTATVTSTEGTPAQDVDWTSSNPSAATVSVSQGVVTVQAVAVGKTTIRATAHGYNDVYGEFELTVNNPIYKMVTSTTQLQNGDTVVLGAYARSKWFFSGTPATSAPSATGAKAYWETLDEISVSDYKFIDNVIEDATLWTYNVDSNGYVSFKDQYNNNKYLAVNNSPKVGEVATASDNTKWTLSFDEGVLRMVNVVGATIDYLYYNNTKDEFSAYIASSHTTSQMRLFKSAGDGIALTGVTTSVESINLIKDDDTSFTYTEVPSFNTDTLSIASSNTDVATISVSGNEVSVHAEGVGSANIVFKNSAEETLKSIPVDVAAPVSYDHITVDASDIQKTYTIGDPILTAGTKVWAHTKSDESEDPVDVTLLSTITANPATANIVSDALSITVSASLATGSGTLDASDTVDVAVNPILAEGVVLTYEKSVFEIGSTANPTACGVTNDDATDKTVTVVSSDPSVIEVTNAATGALNFKTVGTATITATANDASGKSASVELTAAVIQPIDRYINRDRLANLTGGYQGGAEVLHEFDDIAYITVDIMKRSGETNDIQLKSSTGLLKNITTLGGSISKLTINGINGDGSLTVYGSSNGTAYTKIDGTVTSGTGVYNFGDNSFSFFKITNESNKAAYFASFKVEMKGDFATHLNSFAAAFNEATGDNCSAFSLNKWDDLKAEYNKLTAAEKEALKGITVDDLSNGEGTTLDVALRRYDNIITNYSLEDFIVRFTPSNNSNQTSVVNGSLTIENNIMIVVVVSIASVTAIGGFFFLKKRREQN